MSPFMRRHIEDVARSYQKRHADEADEGRALAQYVLTLLDERAALVRGTNTALVFWDNAQAPDASRADSLRLTASMSALRELAIRCETEDGVA